MNRMSELEAQVNGANALKSELSTFSVRDIEQALWTIRDLQHELTTSELHNARLRETLEK